MAEETDSGFGKVAVEKGFCTQAQLQEAMQVLDAVKKLGLEEDLTSILVKKKYLTEAQAKQVRQVLGQRSGVRIAGYEVLERIGVGGMGVVFKARQISLDRIVALKILAPKLAADKSYTDRFLREARAVAKLSHPNIIVGIDVGQEGKYFYFAMEFVDGKTALEILREEGPFKEKAALKIARQITLALEHAHHHGLVHRDVKPDNIMVTTKDEAKLCDLGLAKRMEPGGDVSQPGTAVGTPHYIAPEQARGQEDVDITADIYALGASLYHMVTGRTLFKGETASEIMTQHLTAEAPDARKIRPELSESFCRMMEKMLAKNREDRYPNPTELLAEIDRLIAGKPLKGVLRPEALSSMERTARAAARGPARGTGRGGEVRSTTGPRTPVGPPDPSTGPRKPVTGPPRGLVLVGLGALFLIVVGATLWVLSPGGEPKDGRGAASSNKKEETPKPEVKVVNPTGPTKEAPTPPKVVWEPLEKARRLRQEKPSDYPKLLEAFTAAEHEAPPEVLAHVRRERGEVEQQQRQAFRAKLDEQLKKVSEKVEAKDFPGALALLTAPQFPAELWSEWTEKEVARQRADVEQQSWVEFHRNVEPGLLEQLEQAGLVAAKLKDFREKLKPLPTTYPAASVKDWVEKTEGLIDAKLEQASVAEVQAQEDVFRTALDEVVRTAVAGGGAGLSKAAETLAEKKQFIAERYHARLESFRQDLLMAQSVFDKACAALNTKADTKETLSLRYPAGQTTTYKLTGKISQSKDGPGVWVQGDKGPAGSLFFSKLDEQDLVEQAGLKETTPEGRLAVGVFCFWRGRQEKAYQQLLPLKGDETYGPRVAPYLAWMDERATAMVQQIQKLYVQCEGPRLSRLEKERRRRQASDLLDRLKREYSTTEVYRVRTQKSK
jgi:serine/threonine protein kinase